MVSSFGLPFLNLSEGLKTAGSIGQDYLSLGGFLPSFDFLDPVGYILSYLQFPSDILRGFRSEFDKILSANAFKFFILTIKNIFNYFWDALFGQGLFLYGSEKTSYAVRIALFIIRTIFLTTAAIWLFVFPTTTFLSLIILTILFNFGASLGFISAGCALAFIILNMTTRLWMHHYGDSIDSTDCEIIGKILDSSSESIRELSELVKSSPQPTMKEASGNSESIEKRSLFGRALQWHLSLFNFYDHLLQPLFDQ